uniref:EPS8-like 3b n=1 Tax=Sphaeramia orbicularis TaxID=375764 RepID=A0A672YWC0_9TELE
NDCLAKLKRLDAKGRLWPQEMILEVQGGYLILCDIETKSELESMHLSCIQQTKAMLDSCAYNSVLAVTVQERNKRIPQVFMFQCEDTGTTLHMIMFVVFIQEILNHVLDDLEIFMSKVSAAANASLAQEGTSKKKKKSKKKQAKKNEIVSLTKHLSVLYLAVCPQLVPQYPLDLPPTVLSPLLTEPALHLLNQVVSPEEDALWRSLGDTWNIPRQPKHFTLLIHYSFPLTFTLWCSFLFSSSEPLYMRAIYDFMARNNRELSIMKGDVIQKSKQWWLVRNNRDEEGHIPQNVLEPMRGSSTVLQDGLYSLHSQQVKAWLEYKGFSKITVRSLGVLTGKLLLGMSRDEIRTVCPEEGGRVFFQLQAVNFGPWVIHPCYLV